MTQHLMPKETFMQRKVRMARELRARKRGGPPRPSPWRIGPVCHTVRAKQIFENNRSKKSAMR